MEDSGSLAPDFILRLEAVMHTTFFASARSVAATNLASDVDDTNVHSGKEDFEPRRGIWKERDAAVKAKPLLGPMDVMCD